MRIGDIRSVRVAGVAIVDVVATLAIALVISRATGYSAIACIAIAFASGVAVHTVLGVDTAVQRALRRAFTRRARHHQP